MMAATIEEFANTVAEYEALAISTGEWDGIEPPEFSDDGTAWSQTWAPTIQTLEGADGTVIRETVTDSHPAFARATVYRKGVRIPYTAVLRWDEVLPAVDDWRELWMRKPMTLFGAAAKRAAIRHAFREVVGDRRDADELDPATPQSAPVARDWDAEADAAMTEAEVLELHAAAKNARAVTPALETKLRKRLREVVAVGDPGAATATTNAEYEAPAEPVKELAHEVRQGRAPQDHLPGNRAARRAAARKKGRR